MVSVLDAVVIPSSKGVDSPEDDGYASDGDSTEVLPIRPKNPEVDDVFSTLTLSTSGSVPHRRLQENRHPTAAVHVLSFNGELNKFLYTESSRLDGVAKETPSTHTDLTDSSISSDESPCARKRARVEKNHLQPGNIRRPAIASGEDCAPGRQTSNSVQYFTEDPPSWEHSSSRSHFGEHIRLTKLNDMNSTRFTGSDTEATVEFIGEALTPKKRTFRRDWVKEEKETLFILKQWYTNSWDDIVEVLNRYFEKASLVRRQPPFRKGMCIAMYQDYARTAVSLDLHDRFGSRKRQLEHFAEAVGINLNAREQNEEMITTTQSPSIHARKKRRHQSTLHDYEDTAPTAQRLRSMQPRTSAQPDQKSDVSNGVSAIEQMKEFLTQEGDRVHVQYPSPSTSPLSQTGNLLEQLDHNTSLDATQYMDTPVLEPETPQTPTHPWRTLPALFYRCYDEGSAGVNSPTQLRAGFFHPDDGPPSMPLDADSSIFPWFLSNHIWRRQTGSPFISLTGSLLWAIHKAQQSKAEGRNPHIAVIDAGLATSDGRGYYVGDLLLEERRERRLVGPLRTMGYRGSQEWLVWGEIPSEAILHTLDFDHLLNLANRAINVGRLLRLDSIVPSSNIARIRSTFQAEPVSLTTRVGAAVGRVASLFAFTPSTNPRYVAEFVAHLLQGWAVRLEPHMHTRSDIAQAFVTAQEFGVESCAVLPDGWEEAVESAFAGGINTASMWMEQESRFARTTASSGSRARKRRKRSADS